MGLSLRGSTSGSIDINPPAVAGNNTITLPGDNGSANQFFRNSTTAGIVTYSSMVEDSSGNIGIGTDNPGAKLHIDSTTTNTPLVVEASQNNRSRLVFRNNQETGTQCAIELIDEDLRFNTNSGERMRIVRDGNIGIGLTNPSGKLTVNTVTAATNAILVAASAETSRTYGLGVNASAAFVIHEHIAAADRLVIDSSGRLGIGTASPTADGLHIVNSTQPDIFMGTSTNAEGFKVVYNDTDTVIGNVTSTPLRFVIGNSEKARIDSSGRLLVGTITSGNASSYIQSVRASGQSNMYLESKELADSQIASYIGGGRRSGGSFRYSELGVFKHGGITETCSYLRLQSTDGSTNYFWTDDSDVLRISTNAAHIGTTSGTVVGTQTSDERLKNVGGNVSYGLNEVLQLQPKQYALKTEPDTNKLGFIAQEVESIIPEAVFDTGEELEGHQEGDRTKLGMEYVQLIPVLVNAIKEQQEIIASLEARLSALEGA